MNRLLQDTRLDDEQRELVGYALSAGSSLLRILDDILDDILDFSKLDAGKLTFEVVPFDLRKQLKEIIGIGHMLTETRALSFTAHLGSDLPRWVAGDPTRLRQVLLNLINNAIKLTPDGGLTFTASNEPGGIFFSVSDTGIGVSPEAQGRIFDAFHQAESSTSRRFGGTGLGLSICHQLVQGMGGALRLRSALGAGCDFSFTLPLASCSAEEPAAEVIDEALLSELRVLLAEDNRLNRKLASSVLARSGCLVDVASDGAEAIAKVMGEAPYDVILMDTQMPVMDGLEASSRIRCLPAPLNAVPIIALTANAMSEDRHRCAQAGMDAFVAKPFRKQELLRAMADTLRLRS